jgi:hypothetical protein
LFIIFILLIPRPLSVIIPCLCHFVPWYSKNLLKWFRMSENKEETLYSRCFVWGDECLEVVFPWQLSSMIRVIHRFHNYTEECVTCNLRKKSICLMVMDVLTWILISWLSVT